MTPEEKVQALGFALARGAGKHAGYQLRSPSGDVVLGDGHAASLKQVDSFLDNHIKTKARSLGFKLSTQRHAESLHEYSSGEIRAVQRTSTTGYKLEFKEVVVDKGRQENTKEQEEDRAKRGGVDVIWVTVCGPDYTATLGEHQADIGIDDVDIEVDDKKPKVAPPSLQIMTATLAGHDSADAIQRIGYGNKKVDDKPTKREQQLHRAIEAMQLSHYGRNLALEKLSRAEQDEHSRHLRELKKELEELERQRHNYDPEKDDPVRREQIRQRNVFLRAERQLSRTNIRSRLDGLPANTVLRDDLDPVDVDPDIPAYRAVKPVAAVVAQTRREARHRGNDTVPGSSIAALREQARQRRLAKIAPEIEAAIAAGDHAAAGTLLAEAKGKLPHGEFTSWLAEHGINDRVARRYMDGVKTDSAD